MDYSTKHQGEPREFDSYYDLLVDVIAKDPHVTQKGLAGALAQSVNSVSRKLRHDLVFRLEELPVILAHLHHLPRPAGAADCEVDFRRNYLRLVEFLADLAECLVVRRPDAESTAPADQEMSEFMRRFGELSSRYVEARSLDSPGGRGLSREEKKDLLNLACLVQNRSTALIAALVAEEEVENV